MNVGIHAIPLPPGVAAIGAPLSALAEAHRLLKPDGTLRIETPSMSAVDAIEQRLKDLGFTDITIVRSNRLEIDAKKGSCP